MRRTALVLATIALASLGLSACGAKATLNQAMASLSASPYLQVRLSGSVSGPRTAAEESVLSSLSFEVRYYDATGTNLSQATGSSLDSEVIVSVGATTLADLRHLNSNDYLELDPQALSAIPGEDIPSSTLAAAQLLVGGRWFELPASLWQSVAKPPSSSTRAKSQALASSLLKELTKVIETTPSTTLPGGGLSQSGTLQSIATAIAPTLESVLATIPSIGSDVTTPTSVRGTYRLTLSMSGSSASTGSVTITTPATGGDVAVSLNAAIAHASDPVSAPSGATVVTPALLHELESQATSGSASF